MRNLKIWLTLGLFVLLVSMPMLGVSAIYLRVNQAGYLPNDSKLAWALTDVDLSGQSFMVISSPGGEIVFTDGVVGTDRGPYGNFPHLYELDFSALSTPAVYHVLLGGSESPDFTIGGNVYFSLLSPTLEFFHIQRCGKKASSLHGPCHLTDGVSKSKIVLGEPYKASGGWHDAGDYLKFLITAGFSTNMLLASYAHQSAILDNIDNNSNGVSDILDEALIGLNWILKLWDPERQILYYQVGDASDHEQGWRMPEEDDVNLPQRFVWACKKGKGANVAGKAAAALALGAAIWNDSTKPFYNPERAAIYLKAAKQIYAYGQTRPSAQATTSDGSFVFYNESSWKDDMALAAIELYRATGKAKFLDQAREYATKAGNSYSFSWGDMNGLVHYEIASLDASYIPNAISLLNADLEGMQDASNNNSFRAAVNAFFWGSASEMIGVALEALWYEKISGDSQYRSLALAQCNYVLGANPWGVCWVNSVGTVWAHHPHHFVSALTASELVGFWNEGPLPQEDWDSLGITLQNPDAYSAFQSDQAVYHDDREDYATNEPIITANAQGIALASIMSD